MENSIEEDIILLNDFAEGNFQRDKLENYKGSYKMGYFYYKDIQQALEHILSDYKRVLKENEYMHNELDKQQITINKYAKENEELKALDLRNSKIIANMSTRHFQDREKIRNSIPIQKIKDKIEQYKKILLNCNRFSDVDRIKAINERILELQELLEKQ